jgi:hypothetical protein
MVIYSGKIEMLRENQPLSHFVHPRFHIAYSGIEYGLAT